VRTRGLAGTVSARHFPISVLTMPQTGSIADRDRFANDVLANPAHRRFAYPLQTPSAPRPPGQKQDPGERIDRKWKEGLTNQGPLQKAGSLNSPFHATWRV
jgi:hypothetical protein